MKAMGVFMVLFSSVSFGLCLNSRMKRQIDTLKDLLLFSNNLKTAISYQLVSINDFIHSIGSNEYKNLDFLDDISGFENISLDLSNEENNRIANFFSSLGKFDVKNQISEIEYFMIFLNSKIEERNRYYNQKSKITMVLCISIGAVASIVMI